eukprot:jgi/Ulvmu1/7409/UM036_0069.1
MVSLVHATAFTAAAAGAVMCWLRHRRLMRKTDLSVCGVSTGIQMYLSEGSEDEDVPAAHAAGPDAADGGGLPLDAASLHTSDEELWDAALRGDVDRTRNMLLRYPHLHGNIARLMSTVVEALMRSNDPAQQAQLARVLNVLSEDPAATLRRQQALMADVIANVLHGMRAHLDNQLPEA